MEIVCPCQSLMIESDQNIPNYVLFIFLSRFQSIRTSSWSILQFIQFLIAVVGWRLSVSGWRLAVGEVFTCNSTMYIARVQMESTCLSSLKIRIYRFGFINIFCSFCEWPFEIHSGICVNSRVQISIPLRNSIKFWAGKILEVLLYSGKWPEKRGVSSIYRAYIDMIYIQTADTNICM